MSRYLDVAGFKRLTMIADADVDAVEARHPGWVQAQLDHWARWTDARLRKRYASPFAAFDADPPTPPAIQGWLARLVAVRVMMKRGVAPSDEQFQLVLDDHIDAKAEVKEAADSTDGLFDLPLRTDSDGTGVVGVDARVYAEHSPYVSASLRAERGREEDAHGEGSYG